MSLSLAMGFYMKQLTAMRHQRTARMYDIVGLLPMRFSTRARRIEVVAAMTSGIISLGNNIASKVGEAGCDQVMLKFPSGHFLFMSIGSLAGFAVLVREGANLGVVAHQMAQLVDAVGHVLTPQLRDDLRRMNATSAGGGR